MRLVLPALALLAFPLAAPAASAAPPARAATEGMLAADALVWAPPDLKRQLVRHRTDLMKGVADAVAAETGKRDAAAHQAAAARGARAIARKIREHAGFAAVAYEIGGLVHECAAGGGIPDAVPATSHFLGFPANPFADPEKLLPVPSSAPRWDAALTRATRLIAWLWRSAGGDASLAQRLPEPKGPWPVRE